MWEAVEKSYQNYDLEYLSEVNDLVSRLGEKGIYTMIDMHQDAFARLNCGEGFPDYYAKQAVGKHPTCINRAIDHLAKPLFMKTGLCKTMDMYGYQKDANGWPEISDCQKVNFALYYTSPESMNGFTALYENENGMQDAFVNYWDATSAALASNPWNIGYDPLNEPFPGNVLKHRSLLWHGNFDKNALAPMYEQLYERYQKNDPGSVMWFEPGQFPDNLPIMGGITTPVGFQTPPGGEIGSNTHVLNDHTYCCQISGSACPNGEPTAEEKSTCLDWHQRRLAQRNEDAQRLGVPLFISEFGACLTEENCTTEIEQVANETDKYLVGWAYWEFKNYADLTTSAGTGEEGFYNADGSLQDWKVKALSRSYLRYTQGTLTKNHFNTKTGVFDAEFTADASV